MRKKAARVIVYAAGKCQKCGKESVTERSHYCGEHMDELLKAKARGER